MLALPTEPAVLLFEAYAWMQAEGRFVGAEGERCVCVWRGDFRRHGTSTCWLLVPADLPALLLMPSCCVVGAVAMCRCAANLDKAGQAHTHCC